MELQDYSTETLIKYLRKNRGINIPYHVLTKHIKLKPYFGKVDGSTEIEIERWEGHFGLTQDGRLCLCTPDGKRIVGGTLLIIQEDGSILRMGLFRDDTIIPVDKKRKVIIK